MKPELGIKLNRDSPPRLLLPPPLPAAVLSIPPRPCRLEPRNCCFHTGTRAGTPGTSRWLGPLPIASGCRVPAPPCPSPGPELQPGRPWRPPAAPGCQQPAEPACAGAVRGKGSGKVWFGLTPQPWGCPRGSGGRCCRSHRLRPGSPGAAGTRSAPRAPAVPQPPWGCVPGDAEPGFRWRPCSPDHAKPQGSLQPVQSPQPLPAERPLPCRAPPHSRRAHHHPGRAHPPYTEPTTQGGRLAPVLSFP